jgi:AAA15 family ATPase/GTPase
LVKKISISNYKSIVNIDDFEIGRVNILIGENGSGKTNILEAVTFAAAAVANKLDNEFLVSRGIRVTDPNLMFSGFNNGQKENDIIILSIEDEDHNESIFVKLKSEKEENYPRWKNIILDSFKKEFLTLIDSAIQEEKEFPKAVRKMEGAIKVFENFKDFLKGKDGREVRKYRNQRIL